MLGGPLPRQARADERVDRHRRARPPRLRLAPGDPHRPSGRRGARRRRPPARGDRARARRGRRRRARRARRRAVGGGGRAGGRGEAAAAIDSLVPCASSASRCCSLCSATPHLGRAEPSSQSRRNSARSRRLRRHQARIGAADAHRRARPPSAPPARRRCRGRRRSLARGPVSIVTPTHRSGGGGGCGSVGAGSRLVGRTAGGLLPRRRLVRRARWRWLRGLGPLTMPMVREWFGKGRPRRWRRRRPTTRRRRPSSQPC